MRNTLTFYQRLIMEATGCNENRAPEIEDDMRTLTHNGCLDHLPRNEFCVLARRARDLHLLISDS